MCAVPNSGDLHWTTPRRKKTDLLTQPLTCIPVRGTHDARAECVVAAAAREDQGRCHEVGVWTEPPGWLWFRVIPGGMTEGDGTETGEGGTGTKTCPGDSRGVRTGFGMKSVTSLEHVEDVTGRAGWRWRAKGSQRPPWSSGKRLATHLDEEETADLKGRRGQGLRVGSPARGLATQSRRSSKGSEGSVKGQRPAPRMPAVPGPGTDAQEGAADARALARVARAGNSGVGFSPRPSLVLHGAVRCPCRGLRFLVHRTRAVCTCHVEMVRGVQKCSFLSQDGGKRF